MCECGEKKWMEGTHPLVSRKDRSGCMLRLSLIGDNQQCQWAFGVRVSAGLSLYVRVFILLPHMEHLQKKSPIG